MVFGVFILIFIIGFIIDALLIGYTGVESGISGAILYSVSIIGAMLFVIIEKLDKILAAKEKD